MGEKLTHIDADGRARMVDVSDKPATKRIATAEGRVLMSAKALDLARSKGGKGDVRATAEIAGVMAAKRTADLIPMCHPLALSNVKVRVNELEDGSGIGVVAEVGTTGPTGVEMEALTAVSVACLTIYDMLKAVDRAMQIEGVRLLAKSGGASGDFVAGA
ncbi:MAG: cyclic pyranopterin monophosphate synthase MoaC [Hyphomonadaceae bacterium]|nr:cyclic pyranopterin monophosphate synthase MoaC [Hyphomonadaceae bacterium]